MVVRFGFVSNSSSSTFLLAYKINVYKKYSHEERIKALIRSLNVRLRTKKLKYNADDIDSYHSTVGHMFFQETDHTIGYRSIQSLLDNLNYEYLNQIEENSLEAKAIQLIKQGYAVIFANIPANGDGGSALSNYVVNNQVDYQVDTEELKFFS